MGNDLNAANKAWPAFVLFAPVAIVAILLNQRNFAIGDDYQSFGFYYIMGGMDYFSAVATSWKDPFMAGRPFASITELLPLSMMRSIDQLVWVRYIHLVIFAVIFGLLLKIIKKCTDSSFVAPNIALFMFTLPGIWHMYIMNYGTPMLLAICVALLGSLLTVKYPYLSIKQWAIFAICAAFSIFSYQPTWPLLFIGIFGKMLGLSAAASKRNVIASSLSSSINTHISRDMRSYSLKFVNAIIIVLLLFIINFVLVKFGYNSQRLNSYSDWFDKIWFLLNDLLPLTIYPWLYILFPGQSWIKILSWITFITITIVVIFVLVRSVYKVRVACPRINWYEYLFIFSIATSLIPLTLGMYLFTDQSIAFRRVNFASMVFWFTFLFFLASLVRLTANSALVKVYNYGVFGALSVYIFAFGYFLEIGTVQLASREWNAAICASSKAPLTEPARVNAKNAILQKPFPWAWSGDEFQVSTFSYPTGGMLIWLAHVEANHLSPEFNRWSVELADGAQLTRWDSAYSNCLLNAR